MPSCGRFLVSVSAIAATCCGTNRVEPAEIAATAGKPDTKMVVLKEDKSTLIVVNCPVGIDRASLTRTGDHWPAVVIIRMHLKGLESFEATSGQATLLASVPSTGEPTPRLSLKENGKETAIDKQSPYWADVQFVGTKKTIPLEGGHFEISLPAKLFEGDPKSIELRWVDFYRN